MKGGNGVEGNGSGRKKSGEREGREDIWGNGKRKEVNGREEIWEVGREEGREKVERNRNSGGI